MQKSYKLHSCDYKEINKQNIHHLTEDEVNIDIVSIELSWLT